MNEEGVPTRILSVKHAYHALHWLVLKTSWTFDESTDLSTLSADMTFDAGDRTLDPAMYAEWQELCGDATTLSASQALDIAASFVEKERGWSDDPTVRRIINDLRSASPELWDLWLKAITRTEDDCG